MVEKQKVISSEEMDSDVIAMARADGEACVQIFFIRSGKLIGREYFILEGTEDEANGEVVAEFIKQFYAEAAECPGQVLLPKEVEEAQIIRQWLHTSRGGQKVELVVPREGEPPGTGGNGRPKMRWIPCAPCKAQWEADTNKQTEALA